MISEINVTPMVDVMLVLLIVFMVTAPLLQTGMDVQLPKAGAAPLSGAERSVTVTIDTNGKVHLNNHTYTIDQFRIKAPALFSELGGRPVYLRGDKRISYNYIISAMSALKSAGVDRIGLVTEPR